MSGLLGAGAAYQAMHECDVLVLLGTDFPYAAFMPTGPKIVQVDIRSEHLGRRARLELGLCGDEQLGNDGGYAAKVTGAGMAVEALAERRKVDEC